MMMNTMDSALLFLINTIFDLYLFVLGVRLILVWIGANYFDPLTQFIIKMTDVIVKPTRKLLPNVYGVETASLTWMFAIDLLKFFIVAMVSFGLPNIAGLLLLAFGDIIKIFLQIFFYAILLQAIMSWVQPHSPVNRVLYQITAPIMRPLQRCIPMVGGFDITPIPALIILQLLMMVIAAPLMSIGFGAAIG
jgi:YggT family protein